MKNSISSPFNNLILDKYEQEIEDAISMGDYEEFQFSKDDKKLFAEMTSRHIKLKASKKVLKELIIKILL